MSIDIIQLANKLLSLVPAYIQFFLAQDQDAVDAILEDSPVQVHIQPNHIEFWYKEWLVHRYRIVCIPLVNNFTYVYVAEVCHYGEWIEELEKYMEDNKFILNEAITKCYENRSKNFEDMVNAEQDIL